MIEPSNEPPTIIGSRDPREFRRAPISHIVSHAIFVLRVLPLNARNDAQTRNSARKLIAVHQTFAHITHMCLFVCVRASVCAV